MEMSKNVICYNMFIINRLEGSPNGMAADLKPFLGQFS